MSIAFVLFCDECKKEIHRNGISVNRVRQGAIEKGLSRRHWAKDVCIDCHPIVIARREQAKRDAKEALRLEQEKRLIRDRELEKWLSDPN